MIMLMYWTEVPSPNESSVPTSRDLPVIAGAVMCC